MRARTTWRGDVQGLRGIAVLLVVLYHAGLHVPGGFTGVDVFFAISGYVITGTLLPELAAGGRIRFLRFYARRARRLLPALAALLVFVAVAGTLAAPIDGQRTGALTGIWASVFAANVFLYRVGTGYFDPGATLDPLLHTWTLAVEEQFYVIFPVLLMIGWRLRRRPGAIAAVLALSAVSFAGALALSGGQSDLSAAGRFAFYGSPTRAWEFGLGALVALLGGRLAGGPTREAVGAAGLAAIAVGAFAIDGTTVFPGWWTLLPVLGACAALASPGSLASRALAVRPLVWVGDLSYSWYLWHWPLIVFARAFWPGAGAWAALLSIVPAWASTRYLEAPIRFGPRYRGRATFALAAVCVAVPVAACAGLVVFQSRIQTTAAVRGWNAANAAHAYVVRGCDDETPLGARSGPRWAKCAWRVPHAKGVAYLLGDSNAGHFTEGFVRGANAAGYDAVVAAYEGCPFVDLLVGGTGAGPDRCRRFDSRSLAWLVTTRPSLVVIGNRPDGYIDVASKHLAQPGGAFATARSAKRRLWETGLARTLGRLGASGIPAVVVEPVPWLGTYNPGCAVLLVLRDGCNATVARAAAERERGDAVLADTKAVETAGAPAARVDFMDAFCSGTSCSTVRSGTVLYQDRDHLSIAGSLTLAPRFERVVRAHAVARG